MNEKNGDRGGRHAPPFVCLKSGERFRVCTNTLMDRVDEFEPPSRVQGYVTRVVIGIHNILQRVDEQLKTKGNIEIRWENDGYALMIDGWKEEVHQTEVIRPLQPIVSQ